MSVEDIDWTNPNATNRGFARSALMLAGSIMAIAAPLFLFSIATEKTGSGGPGGVAAAAAICIVAGWSADTVATLAHRAISPLAALLAGMAGRSLPPLMFCLVLAAKGGGREHLAFVVYLLTFYLVILTLDTWWAVQRVGDAAPHAPRRSS